MMNLIEKILEKIPHDCFSDQEISVLIPETPHRRYGLIKRAIARGDIIHLRRGLYLIAKKYQRRPYNLFEIAQKIYGPSYISFESALSYHGWTPETTYTCASACMRRSREFSTPLGSFSFKRVISDPFLTAVELRTSPDGTFLLARPWKAVADYVFVHKKDWKGLHPLIHSLRIEEENLTEPDLDELNEIEKSYSSRRVSKFIRHVLKDLK